MGAPRGGLEFKYFIQAESGARLRFLTLYDLTGWRWSTFFAHDDCVCLSGSTLRIEVGIALRFALTRNPSTVFPVVNAEEV